MGPIEQSLREAAETILPNGSNRGGATWLLSERAWGLLRAVAPRRAPRVSVEDWSEEFDAEQKARKEQKK
jgi:hypothetical protein